jgi:hypothetical protein
MNRSQFRPILEQLESGFTYLPRDKEARAARLNLYFGAMKGLKDSSIIDGFRKMSVEWIDKDFPTPGAVRHFVLDAGRQAQQAASWPWPTMRLPTHQCLMSAKMKVTQAWRLLLGISPYEAHHVFCGGKPEPICPVCGLVQAPFINPLTATIASFYPEECKDWNPYHKGYLLCPKHESIDSPSKARDAMREAGHAIA